MINKNNFFSKNWNVYISFISSFKKEDIESSIKTVYLRSFYSIYSPGSLIFSPLNVSIKSLISEKINPAIKTDQSYD